MPNKQPIQFRETEQHAELLRSIEAGASGVISAPVSPLPAGTLSVLDNGHGVRVLAVNLPDQLPVSFERQLVGHDIELFLLDIMIGLAELEMRGYKLYNRTRRPLPSAEAIRDSLTLIALIGRGELNLDSLLGLEFDVSLN